MSKHDNIEELILKNLEGLNDLDPAPGHFERFEARLQKINQKERKITPVVIWKMVAAAIFVLLIVNQAVMWFSAEPGTQNFITEYQEMTLAEVSSEYEEVEFYYTNAINVGLNQWDALVEKGLISSEEQQMLDSELEEFEQVFQRLQSDLALSPNDERVINAMLEYYQTKLSIINMIVEKLQDVKTKKIIDYETEY